MMFAIFSEFACIIRHVQSTSADSPSKILSFKKNRSRFLYLLEFSAPQYSTRVIKVGCSWIMTFILLKAFCCHIRLFFSGFIISSSDKNNKKNLSLTLTNWLTRRTMMAVSYGSKLCIRGNNNIKKKNIVIIGANVVGRQIIRFSWNLTSMKI